MEERLQKLISTCGLASRRTAEEWITAGRVSVNGQKARLGDRADLDRDAVLVDGKPLTPAGERTYLMLNKPRGYVTTLSDEKGRKNVAQLVSGCGVRVWPVGRLDLDSEGLLLLTDDGGLTHRLLHPSHEVEKEYLVWVNGNVERAIPLLSAPHGAGRGAHSRRPGAPGAGQRRGPPAVYHHPSGEEPPGPPDVRPGGSGGAPAQAGPGGGAVPGPGLEAGSVASSQPGGDLRPGGTRRPRVLGVFAGKMNFLRKSLAFF